MVGLMEVPSLGHLTRASILTRKSFFHVDTSTVALLLHAGMILVSASSDCLTHLRCLCRSKHAILSGESDLSGVFPGW